MVGWNGHEFMQTPGDAKGQGSLVCCSSWSFRVGRNLVIEQEQLFQCYFYDETVILQKVVHNLCVWSKNY